MACLRPDLHPNLTEYVVKLLFESRIFNIIEFLREDTEKLCKVTNLSLYEVSQIKKRLLKDHGVRVVTGHQLYKQSLQHSHLIPTGVKSIDDLFDGGLPTGNIIEICGLSASGKTQLCTTIAVNVAYELKLQPLYIDTKHDFSGRRVRNMLRAKNYPENMIGATMQRILVERIDSVEKFIEILKMLENEVQSNDRLKLVVIDSLPSLFFLYHGDDHLEGIALLVEATSLMRKLSNKYQIVIVVVNLITTWMDHSLEENEIIRSQTRKPSLGKYWQTVPSVRLLIERVNSTEITAAGAVSVALSINSANHATSRIDSSSKAGVNSPPTCLIKVLKSDSYETGKCCHVCLTNVGAMSANVTAAAAACAAVETPAS